MTLGRVGSDQVAESKKKSMRRVFHPPQDTPGRLAGGIDIAVLSGRQAWGRRPQPLPVRTAVANLPNMHPRRQATGGASGQAEHLPLAAVAPNVGGGDCFYHALHENLVSVLLI